MKEAVLIKYCYDCSRVFGDEPKKVLHRILTKFVQNKCWETADQGFDVKLFPDELLTEAIKRGLDKFSDMVKQEHISREVA